jgi:hypothetical protein
VKLSKARGRLAARRKVFDAMKENDAYKRPGSYKKPFPAGRGKSHKK